MSNCPNIAGREIKRRETFGHIGTLLTILTIIYFILFEQVNYIKCLVFIPAMLMTIPLLEARSETCIVNAFFGVKNMGEKYEREKDGDSLRDQKKASLHIMIKGIIISILITLFMLII